MANCPPIICGEMNTTDSEMFLFFSFCFVYSFFLRCEQLTDMGWIGYGCRENPPERVFTFWMARKNHMNWMTNGLRSMQNIRDNLIVGVLRSTASAFIIIKLDISQTTSMNMVGLRVKSVITTWIRCSSNVYDKTNVLWWWVFYYWFFIVHLSSFPISTESQLHFVSFIFHLCQYFVSCMCMSISVEISFYMF